jgi:hypothetical protein
VIAASAPMTVARADDPKLSVFTEGPQTVTIIQGCVGTICVPRVANAKEDGRLQPRKRKRVGVGLFINPAKAIYFVRNRVVNGTMVCEKYAVVPAALTDDDIAAGAAELMKEPC